MGTLLMRTGAPVRDSVEGTVLFNAPTLWEGSPYEKVSLRFKTKDVCFVPSFGMELSQVSRALAANWKSADVAWFPTACLVYPRPRAKTP